MLVSDISSNELWFWFNLKSCWILVTLSLRSQPQLSSAEGLFFNRKMFNSTSTYLCSQDKIRTKIAINLFIENFLHITKKDWCWLAWLGSNAHKSQFLVKSLNSVMFQGTPSQTRADWFAKSDWSENHTEPSSGEPSSTAYLSMSRAAIVTPVSQDSCFRIEAVKLTQVD